MESAQLLVIPVQCGVGAACIDAIWVSFGLKMVVLKTIDVTLPQLFTDVKASRFPIPSLNVQALLTVLPWLAAGGLHESNNCHKGTIHCAKSFTNNYKI